MQLSLLLEPANIFLDIPARTREEVLVFVADRLERAGVVKRSLDLVDLLLDRERLVATVVGEDTAIPHCQVPGLRGIVVAFARVSAPVPFGSEGETARLFFFVLSPAGQPAAHLQVLANIARMLRKAQVRQLFDSARDPGALAAGLAMAEAHP